ncbi:MAG: VCBS repeat-containing protein [Pseudomonas sp.]|uniref:FG-GAP repeat domain-containing protein n=1 Tax=Pseudomonas sp. TaxID=306 RepID=UPI003BB53E00
MNKRKKALEKSSPFVHLRLSLLMAMAMAMAMAMGMVMDISAAEPAPIAFAGAKFYTMGDFDGSLGIDGQSTAIADFDRDGKLDVVTVAPWQGSRISFMWGKSDGSFKAPSQVHWVGLMNSNVIVGDFNGDNLPDIAVTGASTFTVVINQGQRQFANGDTYVLQGSPLQNTGFARDLNGDSVLDLALKTPLGIAVMQGDGDGTFSYGPFTVVPYTAAGGITSIDDANLNGDGIVDLVLTDGISQQAISMLGVGNGSFEFASRQTVPLLPSTALAGDFNHSGLDSMMALPEVNPGSLSAMVLLNDGTGTLLNPVSYQGGFGDPIGALEDFNGDGHLDAVITNTYASKLSFLAGRGDGTFAAAGSVNVGFHAQTPVTGDFNGDGRKDIAVPGKCPGLSGMLGNICLAVLINK